MHSTDGKWHSPSKALSQVKKAIDRGVLIRPDQCEICGNIPEPGPRVRIVAHHYNGYNNPLDVWFICVSCNCRLQGERFHTGQVTREEARTYIETRKFKPISKQCRALTLEGKRCTRLVLDHDYCFDHVKSRKRNVMNEDQENRLRKLKRELVSRKGTKRFSLHGFVNWLVEDNADIVIALAEEALVKRRLQQRPNGSSQ